MSDLQSRPYKPDPEKCCEACVFGRGPHADWCTKQQRRPSTLAALVGFTQALNPLEIYPLDVAWLEEKQRTEKP